ncbi:YkgJ family cysteine cluster protein [Thermodesulfobacteriota bacterium]
MEPDITPIAPDETFRFACSSCVSCFNECCRDLNQFLTPYDILRLKNHLGITSGRFLERYTTQHTGPETGFPVLALKPIDTVELKCPFVTASGCNVYEDRPSSCRIYPLARALSRTRETGKITEHFARLKESHCLGHEQEKTQTVREWIEKQGLAPYNEQNDRLLEIIALKSHLKPGPLDLASGRMFHLALYDLDTFRRKIFEDGLLSDFAVKTALLTHARQDDTLLLQIGYSWIKSELLKLHTATNRNSYTI